MTTARRPDGSKRPAAMSYGSGPGEEVFGWCTGALAEYVAVPEHQLATKPAAALGHVGQSHTQGKTVITI